MITFSIGMYSMQPKVCVWVFVILTDYLSSHSIIVIGAQLIQVQSLICREKQTETQHNHWLSITDEQLVVFPTK